eukprot:101023-Chlamydomonas_euryale.AAC.1
MTPPRARALSGVRVWSGVHTCVEWRRRLCGAAYALCGMVWAVAGGERGSAQQLHAGCRVNGGVEHDGKCAAGTFELARAAIAACAIDTRTPSHRLPTCALAAAASCSACPCSMPPIACPGQGRTPATLRGVHTERCAMDGPWTLHVGARLNMLGRTVTLRRCADMATLNWLDRQADALLKEAHLLAAQLQKYRQ